MPTKHIPILRAHITDGRLCWQGYCGRRWETALQFLNGKEVEIEIRAKRKRTSPNQRKYYFAVLVAGIADALGYGPDEKDEVHEALKLKFLRVHSDGPLPVSRSTESLTTVEREEYHDHIRRWAATELGVYLPLPNEIPEGVG